MDLELRNVTKRFGHVIANDSVDFRVDGGEIVALVGENGAGKSTLMNVLYGLYDADEGEILIDDAPTTFDGPAAAIAAGIGMVHQHFMLVPVFSVLENVILGVEPVGRFGRLDLEGARRRIIELSERYGLEVDPDAIVGDLPVGLRQRVEIIKVLFRDAELVIFDEPTAVLTPAEVEDFFDIVRGLRAAGRGVVFITHKLVEALTVADRIDVIRRGRIVGSADPKTSTEAELAEMMVGRPVDLDVDKASVTAGDPVLSLDDVVVMGEEGRIAVDHVSLEVHAHEIVGIAGVQGNGQTALVDAVCGLRPVERGTIEFLGRDVTEASPREIHEAGVAHIPQNRQEQGLVLDFSIAENMVLDSYYASPHSRGIVMDWPAVREHAAERVRDYDVRTAGLDVAAKTLSGGNQQKLIVARELGRDVQLTVANQPTRGVDIGSIEHIHERLIAERDGGDAVLLVSTELDEILALADRIAVMYRGRIVAERRPESTTATELGLLMAGVDVGPEPAASEVGP